ncbi:uncharacterized protein LOC116249097 [Nymphaea colorata]|nr:uncharacterized protein LOC116249097 [Nymphaea colorata]
MALSKFSLPIIFAVILLFAQVLARDLEEKPAADKKDATIKDSDDGYWHGRGPYGHYPPRCRFLCGHRCCSEAEFAAYSQGAQDQAADEFGDEKHSGYGYGYGRGPYYGYGGRPGYGYGPPHCRYYCGHHCCSAQEYAEYVQDQN